MYLIIFGFIIHFELVTNVSSTQMLTIADEI